MPYKIYNKIKYAYALWSLKSRARSYFNPTDSFVKKSREVFLFNLGEKYPVVTKDLTQRIYISNKVKFGAMSFLVFILMFSSVAIYADQINVDAEHPLYPLKIISEQVQAQVVASRDKVSLHKKFAKRRLNEIKSIKNKKNLVAYHKNKINELANNFIKEERTVEENIAKEDDRGNEASELCKLGSEVIDDDKDMDIVGKNEKWTDFKHYCNDIAME